MEPEVGQFYNGIVKKIVEIGAFVEIIPGTDGLLHISELSDGYVESIQAPPRDVDWFRFTSLNRKNDFYSLELEARHVGKAIPADALRELLLGPAELTEELVVRLGLFHRVQILAEQVLDQRDLEALDVRRVAHDGRDAREPGLAGGSPATLARNELIGPVHPPNDHGLDHARRLDRRRQFL